MNQPKKNSLLGLDREGLIYFACASALLVLFVRQDRLWLDLTPVFLFIFALFAFNRAPKISIDWDWVIYGAFIWAVLFAAVAVSPDPTYAMREVSRYSNVIIFGIAIYITARSDLVRYRAYIYSGMIFGFLLFAPFTLYEYLSGAYRVPDGTRHVSVPVTFYTHIRHFNYHGFLAAMLVSLLLVDGRLRSRILWGLLVFCVGSLVATGGRGAILSILIFFAGYGAWRLPLRKFITVMCITISLIAITIGLMSFTPARSITQSILERSNADSGINLLSSGRIRLWKISWDASLERPLLGHGPGGYKSLSSAQRYTRQPHGVVAQLLVEFGWLGTLFLFFCVGKLGWKSAKKLCRKDALSEHTYMLICAVGAYLVFSQVDGLLFYRLPMYHLAVFLAMLIVVANSNDPEVH